jgi:uncharacterized membrane-anchored protein
VKIKAIEFDADENPTLVSVALTADEVVYLSKLVGRMDSVSADAVMSGGAVINSSVYDGLVCGVANRFFDDGVDQWERDLAYKKLPEKMPYG